jgi:NAD(P)H-hydrate epimerase
MHELPGVVPLYSAAEMRTVDRLAVEQVGIPEGVLMERAGLGAAAEIETYFPDSRRVAVVCGSGNNGGDGFVVARHLAATGRVVDVLLVEPESKIRRDSKINLEILKKLEIPVRRVGATQWRTAFDGYDLVIDAILGTGVTGAPRPNVDVALRAIVESALPVVALDIPTGVDASTGVVEGDVVRADITLTFHGPKIGVAVAPGRFFAGRVKAIDIGIPAALDEPTRQGLATMDMLKLVPPKQRWDTKYTSGSVLCVGGSTGMAGAIALAAQAAMRAGAGIVWAVVPEPIAGHLDSHIEEVQFRGGIADAHGRMTVAAAEGMQPLVDKCDVMVFGPGLGDGDQISALARWAIKSAPALVLDAQGLTAFHGDPGALSSRADTPTLLTPHEGELAKLMGQPVELVRSQRLEWVRHAALQTRCTVLLKGEDSIVCQPNGDFLVATSHTTLATAGTGDVLAGVAGALMARGLPPFLAATCAVLACSSAAEMCAEAYAPSGAVASDLLTRIPRALAG